MLGKWLITELHPQQRVNRRRHLPDINRCVCMHVCGCMCVWYQRLNQCFTYVRPACDHWATSPVQVFISYHLLISEPRIINIAWHRGIQNFLDSEQTTALSVFVWKCLWHRLEKWIITIRWVLKNESSWAKNTLPFGKKYLVSREESERVRLWEGQRHSGQTTS